VYKRSSKSVEASFIQRHLPPFTPQQLRYTSPYAHQISNTMADLKNIVIIGGKSPVPANPETGY
jgi:hypothetical protein